MEKTKEELKRQKRMIRKAKAKAFMNENADVIIGAVACGVCCGLACVLGYVVGSHVGVEEGFKLGAHIVPVKALLAANIITEADIKEGRADYIIGMDLAEHVFADIDTLKSEIIEHGGNIADTAIVTVCKVAH